jgi:hypothetical protein
MSMEDKTSSCCFKDQCFLQSDHNYYNNNTNNNRFYFYFTLYFYFFYIFIYNLFTYKNIHTDIYRHTDTHIMLNEINHDYVFQCISIETIFLFTDLCTSSYFLSFSSWMVTSGKREKQTVTNISLYPSSTHTHTLYML